MAGRLTQAMALILCCCAGCTVDDIPSARVGPAVEPIGLQVLALHPELKTQRFSDILNFESASDLAFLDAPAAAAQIDPGRAHTGHSSLRLGNRTTIRLRSVLGSREFPDTWTLLGGYFWSDRDARVTLICHADDVVMSRHTTTLSPRRWTPAMVDLAGLSTATKSSSAEVMLTIELESPGAVWLDDVILIDNMHWTLGITDGQEDWTLCRRGFSYFCTSRGRFTLRLASAEFNPIGWTIEEANILRMRFNSTGAWKSLTIYPDGRSYRDGAFAGLTDAARAEPLWAQQMQSPAQVQVAESMGRVNRNSIGDANNDGFNETRGAYTVLATGPRIELAILPRTTAVLNPVLEISGLPAGDALVTVEGSLVEKTVRLRDGTLLVELPLRVDRAVTVNVRVQQAVQ